MRRSLAASPTLLRARRAPLITPAHPTGYSLPLEGFLFNRPKGRRRLMLDVSSPIEDVTIEELETRIVLPEVCVLGGRGLRM